GYMMRYRDDPAGALRNVPELLRHANLEHANAAESSSAKDSIAGETARDIPRASDSSKESPQEGAKGCVALPLRNTLPGREEPATTEDRIEQQLDAGSFAPVEALQTQKVSGNPEPRKGNPKWTGFAMGIVVHAFMRHAVKFRRKGAIGQSSIS
ncbi:hypothetical protein CYMTET_46224, partial [Cymbomonas tetramitiformis]